MMLRLLTCVTVCLALTSAHLTYKNKIPNYDTVPNPCPNSAEKYWSGVGSVDIYGKGENNQFGKDFVKNEEFFTEALCRMDSDGDGRTNGEELGDPECKWKPGSPAKHNKAISHPGVCDPNPEKFVTEQTCNATNSWLRCQPFTCPAFEKAGIESKELKFKDMPVPTEVDSNKCQSFSLPAGLYHIIGFKPIINQKEVVHDIIVFACDEKPDVTYQDKVGECSELLTHCQTPIGLWSPATDGQCFSDDYGLPMGTNGYKNIVLQIHYHYHDPPGSPSSDSSGMTLYYTRTLRPNTARVIRTGQRNINLAEKKKEVEIEGKCTKSCTELMPNKTTKIVSAMLRMNRLGISGSLDVMDGSSVKKSLINHKNYDVHQPQLFSFSNPVSFDAGNELKIKCSYTTEREGAPVRYGTGKGKEICSGFVTVYPAPTNFEICSQWKDITMCSLNTDLSYGGCDRKTFYRLIPVVEQYCNDSCDGLCAVMIRGFRHTQCYKDHRAEFIDEIFVDMAGDSKIKNKVFPLIKTCLQKVSSAGRNVPLFYNRNSAAALVQALVLAWFSMKMLV